LTATGSPLEAHSHPPFTYSPTSSFYLVSMLIAGRLCAIAAVTFSLICLKLRVAVRMLGALLGLAVSLQAVAQLVQQPRDGAKGDLVPRAHASP